MRKNFFIFFLSAIITLLIAELFCRHFLPETSDTFIVKIDNVKEKYHHRLLLKEPLEKPDNSSYRILFLGDSFTYGSIQEEFSYPRLVEEYFKVDSNHNSFRVQVFNLSTPSYSPSIYGVLLRDFLSKLNPQMVVVAIDDSDPQDDYFYSASLQKDNSGLPVSVYPSLLGVPRSLQPIARELAIVRFSFASFHKIFYFHKKVDFIGKLENRLDHYNNDSLPRWESLFTRTISLLDVMVNYCQQRNISVVLVNYPYAPAVTTKYCIAWRKKFNLEANTIYNPIFHKIQKEYALSKHIPYYDFTDFLRNLADHEGIYLEVDGHFSAKGNSLFASQLVKFLAPFIPERYQLNVKTSPKEQNGLF